jgi:sugar O-acyltransferase (sialic acid O-acetyltransferase NeuD family)
MTPPVHALIIVGAGGHATVLADALLLGGMRVLGLIDKDPALHGQQRCGLPVLGNDAVLDTHARQQVHLVNGIGGIGRRGDDLRQRVQGRLEAQGWHFVGVRHPQTTVSCWAQIDPQAQLLAGCVVQAQARIAKNCIVNTGALIEHDVQLEEFVHVAPGAVVCGFCQVGPHSHVGAHAVLLQAITLPAHTVVGAGAVVLASSVDKLASGRTLIGNPAHPLERSL